MPGGMSIGTGGGMSMPGSTGIPEVPGLEAAGGASSYLGPAAIAAGLLAPTAMDFISNFGGKNKDQKGRDEYRKRLQESGLYDQNFDLTLSDGTKVNMGQDGSVKNYNVDFSIPGIDKIVSYVNPFAFLVSGGDQKKANDLAGELTNALKDSKDPLAEARRLYEQAGLTYDSAIAQINKLDVDDQTKNVFRGTIDQLGLRGAEAGSSSSAVNQSNELARIRSSTNNFLSKMNASAQANSKASKQAAVQQTRSSLLNNLLQDNASKVNNINFPQPKPSNPAQTVAGPLAKFFPNAQPQVATQPQRAGASLPSQQLNQGLSKILGYR